MKSSHPGMDADLPVDRQPVVSLRPATLNGWSKDFKAVDAAMLDAIYEFSRL